MKQYRYNAVSHDGKKVEGLVEAKSEAAGVAVLRGKGLIVTKMVDMESAVNYKMSSMFSKITDADVVNFTRQFSTMVGSGLSMVNALNTLRKKAKPAMGRVIDDLLGGVEGGESLFQAMSKHPDVFSPIYLALVKAGEMAGVLNEVLARLTDTLEQSREFKAKVKGAMLYPAIMGFVMVVVAIVMIFFVMPKISELYSEFDADLPGVTTIILSTSEFLRTKWYMGLVIFAGGFLAFYRWINTVAGKKTMDAFIFKVPYLGDMQNKIISTDIVRTLSMLVKSGVSIVESLEVVELISTNSVYKKGINEATKNVEKGISLSASFAKEAFFPDMVIQMMTVGEETGKLDEMLEKIANQFQKDSLIALEALTKAIEPAMIIILGLGVGVLVMAIIMPIYNLTSQF